MNSARAKENSGPSLHDRVLAITGASGNLGNATARAVLDAGGVALLLDCHIERAKQAFAADIEAGRARAREVDLGSEAAATQALRELVGEGGFDGIVCTVGGYKGGVTTVDSPWSDWQAMFELNVGTAVACTKAALSLLLPRKSGSIVHVASLAALEGSSGHAAYSGAKAALLRFTQSLAAEVKDDGVRVNAVLPGTLDTPQNRSWMSPDAVARAIELGAVADVAVFLLSDAARAVNGAALPITGRQ